MSNKKHTINVPEGTKELVIRHGEADPIIQPLEIAIVGTISAPSDFMEVRSSQVDKMKAIIMFSFANREIVLEVDPTDKFAPTITGKLVENPVLKNFGINTQKLFTIVDMIRFLKMNRAYFAEVDKCMSMVNNLNQFKAKINVEIEKLNDNRGNKKDLTEVSVKTDIPLTFELSLPMFIGHSPVKFQAEICFDVRDAGISLWLESVELAEMLIKEAERVIAEELKTFDEYVVIET